MKIYSQLNNNDCGIAVTQTIIKEFKKQEVTKEELYKYANVTAEGLSILDLEKLNEKYGILLESYEMEYEEFINHKTNDPFILVINRNGFQHFVIGKKDEETITLYDTDLGKHSISYQKLKDIYLNIFITINTDKKKNFTPEKLKEDKQLYD